MSERVVPDPDHPGAWLVQVGVQGVYPQGAPQKVQAQIQGEEIRVTGKSRDDLQSVMALVRGGDLGQPFQFKNFRD